MSIPLRLALLLFLLPVAALSQEIYVPEALRDWQEWVMKDREYRNCPFFFNRRAEDRNDFICAWPESLDVAIDSNGGRFTQQWIVYGAEQWLALPGDAAYWPDRVTANGRAVTVVMHNDAPSLRLAPGRYAISGSFAWDERPGVLRVPDASGLVSLTIDGRAIERPSRTPAGLFLGEIPEQTQARDTVRAEVYRLVFDDVPTRLTTHVRIDVSGSVREELFGPMLPDGFVPLSIESQLPARLEPDGNLRLQVRPGRWEIELSARAADVRNSITSAIPQANLPDNEIWSYRSNDRLRVSAAEGLPPVDPQQVQVPGAWRNLPAFRIEPGLTFEITERSRGMVSADNELTLQRRMWLDFSGQGFVVNDQVGGSMRTGWRLDMTLPYALLSATENGTNLLVTNGEAEGYTGVELRRSDVGLDALGRIGTRGAMPVTGWDSRFASVATELHLPPGHKLLAAPGADRVPGSWVSQWQLLDFFLVMIITIAAWRLFGRNAGLIALLALTLSFHELNAPAWPWLNLLIAIALMRVAPSAGRLRQSVRVYRAVSAVLLVVVLVPFIASQLRIAIYPQLEPQYPVWRDGAGDFAARPSEPESFERGVALEADADLRERRLRQAPESVATEEVLVAAQQVSRSYARYAPNAIVQAGPGLPSWQWNTYYLSWSGPVDAGQTLRLIVLPRWAVSGLRFVEVLLLLLFAAMLATEMLERRIRLPGGLTLGGAQAASLLSVGFVTVLLSVSPQAQAQVTMPDASILEELENRLLEPPDCVPRCAEIVAADIAVDTNAVRMSLTVHALADIAIPLPGAEQGWRPTAILIDGTAMAQVLRGQDQALWLRLDAGRHSVILRGPVPAVDTLEIPFPTPPRVIEVSADEWFVAGIKDRRLLSGSLQLTRLQAEGSGEAAPRWESSRFPPFVRVERTIELDLDWRVMTTVIRIAPARGALTLNIPLLEGETVVTEGLTADDGAILVSMNPNQRAVSWRSNLPRTSPLDLVATAGESWQDVWRIGVGSIWHAEFSGVPESESADGGSDARLAEFFPRGGERLTIAATRPEASAGSTLAFDAISLDIARGNRSSTTMMTLKYRSTRGEQHVLRLPTGADVTEVVIDGRVEPLRADADELTVPILPGEHTIVVNWRTDGEVAMRSDTPAVDVGAPASNITLNLGLPANRWLLASNGPRLGPAVLYWSELAVLVLFAVILGRIGLAPLRTWHWLLLGLGFSTFNWPVLGIVIAWLLACGAREKWRTDVSWWQFNLIQVAVAGLTIVALMSIVSSLPVGLLGTPDMHVTGNDSYGNSLRWFADRSDSVLPVATAWSVPIWIYKVLILAWALWLSFALVRWLPWVWQCFSSQGYWRPRKIASLRPPVEGK